MLRSVPKAQKIISLTAAVAGLVLLAMPGISLSEEGKEITALAESVSTALQYNPRLKVLIHNRDAISFERDRAYGGYLPRLDFLVASGTERHSDSFSRAIDEDDHFEIRTETSARLTQLLYDGGETDSLYGIEDKKLKSARLRVFDNAEAIALDAVVAHLTVYQQQELVGLAEKNIQDHQNILKMLEDRQRAGAGSIAEVTQTQGRLALARATLAQTESTLQQSLANYQRVVGTQPGTIEFPFVPQNEVPKDINEALWYARTNNPKVQALAANVEEAGQRVELSKSNFYPKVNLEASASYEDQVESSQTWEENNQIMVRMHWNLFNGGADNADRKAAMSRKLQAASAMEDQLVQILEETRITWAEFQAAKARAVSFGDAVNFSNKTLDSYLKQFNVGQRTLLDVLDARNELFQASGQLVTAKANEVIAFYRLMALGGKLNETLEISPEVSATGKVENL